MRVIIKKVQDPYLCVTEIEDELDVVIETDENVQTVDQLVAHIEKAQSA